MKILLVSWSILPYKGGSSNIVENLTKNFSNAEMVVLGGKSPFDDPVFSRSPESPEYIYYPSELSFFGRGKRFFSWYQSFILRPLVDRIKEIVLDHNITYIIGVYPNALYCRAACIAAEEMKLPFSSYFHNTYVENTQIKSSPAEKIQKEIFEASQYIFVMSKGMKDFYEEKYRLGNFVPLVHTFDKYPKEEPQAFDNSHKEKFDIVAIGNFNESNKEATARFISAIKDNPSYELYVYTHVPKVLLKKRGIDINGITYKSFIHPDKVIEELQKYDFCLLTHGFTGGYGEVEYKTIFPTRTIPLLLSGKPIIAHSPDGSFLNNFIREHECAFLINKPSEKAVIDGINLLVKDIKLQNKLVQNARKTANMFYGPEVAGLLRNLINQSAS